MTLQNLRSLTGIRSTAVPSHGRQPADLSECAGIISAIRDVTENLGSATSEQLQEEVFLIRREIARGRQPADPELLTAGLALVCEALQRSVGVRLYDVQLTAAIALSQSCIAQMQTGEGKTFVAVTSAAYLGMAGRGVHVVTPNTYLADRDHQLAKKVLKQLGMTAGLLPERTDAARKRPAYDCDVTYGTGHEFGFEYLRDQLTLRNEQKCAPGVRLLARLQRDFNPARVTMQRGLEFAVIDEADSVLIDDASSPLVISLSSQSAAPDEQAHRTALILSELLQPDEHFQMDPTSGLIVLTPAGLRRCHSSDVAIPVACLVRPWSDYVQQALRARLLFRRDVHYVIEEGEVRIVDETTGRIFEDRSWQDGLHQAIEAREGLRITSEKDPAAQITRQRFFRLYRNLCGMTGTATGCEQEFADVYRLKIREIPLRVPSARRLLPTRYFATAEAKWSAIVEDLCRIQKTGRPILVGTRTIADSELLSARLRDAGVEHQLLNGLQNSAEAEIVERAGNQGTVTIATNLAGRGTDISLSTAVRHAGGLHVAVTECQFSGRMDRQLIGRCGRQGDPGSAQIYVSAEDVLLQLHGPWLAAAIQRDADEFGEAHTGFNSQLHRVQSAAERHQQVGRQQMLLRDTARDSLFRKD
ncbi:MAG: DEAD/DEAH box helicase [Planctomyces sp.]